MRSEAPAVRGDQPDTEARPAEVDTDGEPGTGRLDRFEAAGSALRVSW